MPAGGGELHRLAARRGAQVEHALPVARAEQPRGERGGEILHPPGALVEARQVGDRAPRGEADMAGQQADRRRAARPASVGRIGSVRSSGGGAAIARRGGVDHRRRPRRRASARRPAAGSVGSSGSVAPRRISVPNTPWTSLRGPPSTSGSTVAIAACGGVPSTSIWTSAMRSAKRALASSGSALLRRRIDQRVEIGQTAQHLGGDAMGERAVGGRGRSRVAPATPVRAAARAAAPRRAGAARRGARRRRGVWLRRQSGRDGRRAMRGARFSVSCQPCQRP